MKKHDYQIKPISFTNVKITDKFWSSRFETNRIITIPYAFKRCEETGRIANFSKAAGLIDEDITPDQPYDDSDVFKIIEGAAYSLEINPDPKLEKYVDDIIDKIAAAQEDDGYLYTIRTINPKNPHMSMGKERWEKVSLESHELYNIGHIIESAVAYYQATGKRKLLDVAIKSVNLIGSVFGSGKNESAPGHQEIELALIRLYRNTGNEEFLDLAKFFLDIRGSKDAIGYMDYIKKSVALPIPKRLNKLEFNQTHKKVIEQDEAIGHAVRATYMYSAMVDIAALKNDKNYINAINRLWDNVVSKKLAISGGIGARRWRYGEAFGNDYELPNMKVYNETCASIANVFWNHRMFLLHGDAKYIDVMERILYNGVISGISLNGNLFFYPNPLASKGYDKRSPWFTTACCPSSLARFIPSIPSYIYAQDDNIIYVNLFVGNTAHISLDKNPILITQETDYPWNDNIKITINLQNSKDFNIAIRLPGWSQNRPVPSDLYSYINEINDRVIFKVNGEQVNIIQNKGFVYIKRRWNDGDIIEFEIPMPIRRVIAHEKVKNNNGRVALERGPIVYCVEWPDNNVEHLFNLFLDNNAELKSEYRNNMLNGIVVIAGSIHYLQRSKTNDHIEKIETEFLAIPYYAWAHRGKGEMTIWMLRDVEAFGKSLD